MIPPPAMTTSALSMTLPETRAGGAMPVPRHAPYLEDQLQRGKGRDVAVVERRRDLDHVKADQVRPIGGGREQVEGLPRRQAAGRRDLRPRSKGGIEGVDVEGDVYVLTRQPVGDPTRRAFR